MKSEDEPIAPDEVVIRLIWKAFFKRLEPREISPKAFMPKPTETDGISVFRESCLVSPEGALGAIADAKRDMYGIVRLSVAALAQLGLSVIPARIETVPGHAVIPQVNIADYKADPVFGDDILDELAGIAKTNVIRYPLK